VGAERKSYEGILATAGGQSKTSENQTFPIDNILSQLKYFF